MDDEMLRHYCNEDTFVLEIEQVRWLYFCLLEQLSPFYQTIQAFFVQAADDPTGYSVFLIEVAPSTFAPQQSQQQSQQAQQQP